MLRRTIVVWYVEAQDNMALLMHAFSTQFERHYIVLVLRTPYGTCPAPHYVAALIGDEPCLREG